MCSTLHGTTGTWQLASLEMTYSERPMEVACQRAPFDEVPTSGGIIVSDWCQKSSNKRTVRRGRGRGEKSPEILADKSCLARSNLAGKSRQQGQGRPWLGWQAGRGEP